MRIGICTFHYALNAGAVLQAYALQTILEKYGHEVFFVDYRISKRYGLKDFVGKGFFKTINKWEDFIYRTYYNRFGTYERVLNIGEYQYSDIEELKDNPPGCDVLIAGSDQIWNVGSKSSLNRVYFLDFGVDNVTRVAFAASLGQCQVPEKLHDEMQSLLGKFDAVSVRERNGVEFIQSLLNGKKTVEHISDPTMLLDPSDYIRISDVTNECNKSKYIASYILSNFGNEQFEIINSISKLKKLQIINLRNPDTCIRLQYGKNVVVTPTKWLSYIYNSEFVICSSFHAVVFSLIFHKPFLVVTPYINQRIVSLLEKCELQNRIFYQNDEKKLQALLNESINWFVVDEMIMFEREKAVLFLNNSIKKKHDFSSNTTVQ